ncbi:MAG: hypothetical protein KY055_00990, partial [Candidatus Nealsonbacteria bacterium]|nr:hypothetical protein [Candidatus Nealsonbacteria bacterium]
ITMGPQTVFEAKKILLLASGENKAEAVAKFIEGPITPQITASILQKHPDTIVILDQAAASKITCPPKLKERTPGRKILKWRKSY